MAKTTTVYPIQQGTNVDVAATPVEVLVEGNNQTVESTTQASPVQIIVPDVTIYSAGIQGPAGAAGADGPAGPAGPVAGPGLVAEQLPFVGSGIGPTKTQTGINGNVIYEGFGIADELFMVWILPVELDRATDVIFQGSFIPLASEVGTFCSWEIHITAHDHTGTNIDGIVTNGDVPLNATAFVHADGTFTIPAATYLLVNVDALHLKLVRVVSSNDPTFARVGVSDVTIRYTDLGKVGQKGDTGSLEDEVAKARRTDFDAPYIYKGRADPGTLDATAGWEIERIEKVVGLDGITDYVHTYAAVVGGVASTTSIWDDRATLGYT